MSLSFKPELMEKVLDGQKTVTRRKWPVSYKEGQVVSIVPGMGRIACGKVKIIRIDFERVHDLPGMDVKEARREGFETPEEFADYWKRLHGWAIDDDGHTFDPIARIDFALVEVSRTVCDCCEGIGTIAVEESE